MDGQGDATFSVLDSNGDGRLSLRDIRRAADRFSELDQNADGEIALAELPLVLSLTLERGAPPAANPAAQLPQRAAPAAAPPDAPRWFSAMDANGDGDISRREFLGPSPLFDRLDLNQDGFVDVPEAGRSAPDDRPAPTTPPQADLPP
jgi:Ca2+-binding EF-hand superfamily protein